MSRTSSRSTRTAPTRASSASRHASALRGHPRRLEQLPSSKKSVKPLAAVAIAALLTLGAALSAQPQQQNIDKLKQMKMSGTDPNIPLLPQTGRNADQSRFQFRYEPGAV